MEWFQIRRNHYTLYLLILLAKSVLPLQRQTSTHLGVDAANRLVGATKSAYYEKDNKQQQEHHEQEN